MGQINDSLHVGGQLSYNTFLASKNSIAAEGVIHRFPLHYFQAAGADIVDATVNLHTFVFGGAVTGIVITASTAPDGGNKLFTVDLKKGNQGGAFASILTAPVQMDDAHANRQVITGVLSSSPTVCSAGDTLQLVVDAQGSTGSQGQGLIVTVFVLENGAA